MGKVEGDSPTEVSQHRAVLEQTPDRACAFQISSALCHMPGTFQVHSRYEQVAQAWEAAVQHSCVTQLNAAAAAAADEDCAAWHMQP